MKSFYVSGIPVGQKRPRTFMRGGRAITWSPKSDWYDTVYKVALKNRPETPMDGALRVSTVFTFPRPKTGKHGFYKMSRPDADNLQKAVFDAMTKAGWWVDDSRAVAGDWLKQYVNDIHPTPGVLVTVESL